MSGGNYGQWSTVVGKNRGGLSRGYRGGHSGFSGSNGARQKQPTKRQRTSNGSAGSSSDPSKVYNDIPQPPTLSADQFRSMSIDGKLENIFQCLQGLTVTNERLLRTEQVLFETRNTGRVNKGRINLLAYKSIDNEARQRRNNLIFWGIPETFQEDSSATIKQFLADHLELDPDSIFIQRAHRMGRFQNTRGRPGQPVQIKARPLIAACRDYPDVELILSNVRKLAGSNFGINRDFPQEIVNARKTLSKRKKELKSQNPSANISIRYPAKLIMDKKVVKDMFPDWAVVMKQDRLNMGGYDNRSDTYDVFESDENPASDESDMDTEHDSHNRSHRRDDPPRQQPDIPPHAMLNLGGHIAHPGDTSAVTPNAPSHNDRSNSPTKSNDETDNGSKH